MHVQSQLLAFNCQPLLFKCENLVLNCPKIYYPLSQYLFLLQNCPNNIRKRVPETQYSEMFLHKIPVLQWSKHFSSEEYQRLSHYGGAHGWGSVSAEGVLFLGICLKSLIFENFKCTCSVFFIEFKV